MGVPDASRDEKWIRRKIEPNRDAVIENELIRLVVPEVRPAQVVLAQEQLKAGLERMGARDIRHRSPHRVLTLLAMIAVCVSRCRAGAPVRTVCDAGAHIHDRNGVAGSRQLLDDVMFVAVRVPRLEQES